MALATPLPSWPSPAFSSMGVKEIVDDAHGIIDDPSQNIPEFRYKPLDLKPSGIRLLVLQPLQEGAGDLIRCELHHVTFGEKPVYKALSYTWGTSEETKPILMNNQRFEIRENLHDALVHLRPEIEGQALWVDAVCINQRDDEERCSQVSFMDHIYSRAICVLVWLGGYPPSLPELRRGITHWFGDDEKRWIFDHPYWTRLWVIQEIGLARNLKLCVQKSVSEWETIDDISRGNLAYLGPIYNQQQRRIQNISNKRQDRHGYSNRLEILLESFQYAECQNPRDKIFGFLGLAHDCQDGSIQVDYGKPLFDLYAEVISFFCRRKLFANGATTDLDRSMRLVRFSQLLHKLLTGLTYSGLSSKLASNTVQVRGAIGGEIIHLGPTYDEFISDPRAGRAWKLSFEDGYNGNPESLQLLRENNEAYSVLLHELSQDQINKTCAIHPGMYSRAIDAVNSWQDHEDQWQHQELDSLQGRVEDDETCIKDIGVGPPQPRLFLATNRFIGLVPKEARRGDLLCQFWETNVVALLRKEQEGESDESKVYRVIGRVDLSTAYLQRLVPQYDKWHKPPRGTRTMILQMDLRTLSLLTC